MKTVVSLIVLLLFTVQSSHATWERVNIGTLAWLRSIRFVNEQKGWISGSNGTLMETSDGGDTWHSLKNVTQENIRDVFFRDENNGWLLCERSVYSAGKEPLNFVLNTSDGGRSWETAHLAESRERATRIFFSNSGKGLALGETGTIWESPTGKPPWNRSVLAFRNLLLGAAFLKERKTIMVGGGGLILVTEDGGRSWNSVSAAVLNKNKLNSIFFVNERTGWTVGNAGTILSTSNGGKTWAAQLSGVAENLNDVFFTSETEGFTVGNNGTILHTTDGGQNWSKEPTPTISKLERVVFLRDRGFAIGFGGVLLSRSK